MEKSKAGFTLIEILVIFAIFTVLLSLTTASFSTIERTDKLNSAISEITSILSLAQSQTISGNSLGGENPLQFEVYFEADRFTLLPEDIPTELPKGIRIISINLPQGKIIFARVTGQVSNFDPEKNFLILKEERTNLEKKVMINKLGVVTVE